jgi:hypothetical protein
MDANTQFFVLRDLKIVTTGWEAVLPSEEVWML